MVFLLGEPENKTLTQPLLEQESLEHGDLVQVSLFMMPLLEKESLEHRDIVQVSSFTLPLLEQESLEHALLQGLLKMKLTSGKVQF